MTRPYICWTCGFDTVSEWDFNRHKCDSIATPQPPAKSTVPSTESIYQGKKMTEKEKAVEIIAISKAEMETNKARGFVFVAHGVEVTYAWSGMGKGQTIEHLRSIIAELEKP